MILIEALKRVKLNEKKIQAAIALIQLNSARLSHETSAYPDPVAMVAETVQSARDLVLENQTLMHRIHKTNLQTMVTIRLGDTSITRSIDEWIYRRDKGAGLALSVVQALTDRNLKETVTRQSDGTLVEIKIVRHYDAAARDQALAVLREEPTLIDSVLEIVNATTTLLE
jgi:hypothetical protein